MPGGNRRSRSRAEIILDYIKAFIWSVLVILAVFLFRPDFTEMLKSGVWKSGVLEVGNRESNTQTLVQDAKPIQKDYLINI